MDRCYWSYFCSCLVQSTNHTVCLHVLRMRHDDVVGTIADAVDDIDVDDVDAVDDIDVDDVDDVDVNELIASLLCVIFCFLK